jgi:hypothetical protein
VVGRAVVEGIAVVGVGKSLSRKLIQFSRVGIEFGVKASENRVKIELGKAMNWATN